MRFTFRKASWGSDDPSVYVEVNTIYDLAKIQETMIAEAIERTPNVETRQDLIMETPFTYELIIDFKEKTIEFRDYWTE